MTEQGLRSLARPVPPAGRARDIGLAALRAGPSHPTVGRFASPTAFITGTLRRDHAFLGPAASFFLSALLDILNARNVYIHRSVTWEFWMSVLVQRGDDA